jgi:hypothetical protein
MHLDVSLKHSVYRKCLTGIVDIHKRFSLLTFLGAGVFRYKIGKTTLLSESKLKLPDKF